MAAKGLGGGGAGGGGLGGMGGMAGMGDLLRQAQEMQRKMAKVQEDLRERVVEGSAGGGMVTAAANGQQELVKIKISQDVVDPSDIGMLEDLVVAAVNQALKKADELRQKEMGKVTGGIGMPGLF